MPSPLRQNWDRSMDAPKDGTPHDPVFRDGMYWQASSKAEGDLYLRCAPPLTCSHARPRTTHGLGNRESGMTSDCKRQSAPAQHKHLVQQNERRVWEV